LSALCSRCPNCVSAVKRPPRAGHDCLLARRLCFGQPRSKADLLSTSLSSMTHDEAFIGILHLSLFPSPSCICMNTTSPPPAHTPGPWNYDLNRRDEGDLLIEGQSDYPSI